MTAGAQFSLSIIGADQYPTIEVTYENHDSYVSKIGLDYANWESDYGTTINGAITDNGDTTYNGAININWAGQYSLAVQVGGSDVIGYPVTINVVPDSLDPASCVVRDELPSEIPATLFGAFRVQGRDQYHNNVATSILVSTSSR